MSKLLIYINNSFDFDEKSKLISRLSREVSISWEDTS